MNALEALRTVSAYPIPTATVTAVATGRGIELTDDADSAFLAGRPYRLAMADLLNWLSMAPNVTQGGQSYTLNEEDRKRLRIRANELYKANGEPDAATKYGYKGSQL